MRENDWWLPELDDCNNGHKRYLLFFFIRKSLTQKTALLNVKKLQGETTERTWFHCYALWLYTGQVESLSSSSENNLFLQTKMACTVFCNCPTLTERIADKWGWSCHLTSTLIFSSSLPPEHQVQTRLNRRTRWQEADWMLSYTTLHLPDSLIYAALPFLGQVFFFFWW